MLNSPVERIVKEVIKIDRRKSDAIYLQLVFQFINAIRLNQLTVGMKLPGTRIIGQLLRIHRQTVVKAIEELAAQGWLEIRPQVGAFILNPETNQEFVSHSTEIPAFFHDNRQLKAHSFNLDSPFEKNDCKIQLNDGQPDIHLFDISTLARNYLSAFQRKNVIQQLNDISTRKNAQFISQLSNYLNVSHHFQAKEEEIVVAESKEMLLYAISQLLIKQGDNVVIGKLSHYYSNMIFQQVGAKLQPIATDENGIDVAAIRQRFNAGEIQCVYINSSAHYPTTAQLSIERRRELLQLSEDYGFFIVEENEDFELNYEETLLPYLYATQNTGNVIFIGGLGRFLPPAFQLNFLLAPSDLTFEIEKYLKIIDPYGNLIKQQVLAEMIRSGDMNRYRWKAIKVYQKRRNDWIDALTELFADNIQITIPKSGFALWIVFQKSFSLLKWQQICKKNEVFIPTIVLYQNAKITAIRLGFSSISEGEIKKIGMILYESWIQASK